MQTALNATPFSSAFETPLSPSLVFSLAAPLIQSCPSTNPPLFVNALPNLVIAPANATINQTVTVALTGQADFIPTNIPSGASAYSMRLAAVYVTCSCPRHRAIISEMAARDIA